MSDIFISYAEEDRATAKSLAELLRKRGWSVWWDRVIPIGKSYDRVIEEALDSAKCVLVLWSKSSAASHWVNTEADEGLRRGVLIPVLIEETKIPLGFRRLQTANLIGWQAGQQNSELSLMLEAIIQTVGAPLHGVPSKFELGNELKLVKAPRAKAARAKAAQAAPAVQRKTVFQKRLLQLIEYAKNRFQDIMGKAQYSDEGYMQFESSFFLYEAGSNAVWRQPDGKYYFTCSFAEIIKEPEAKALFNKLASEMKSVLDQDWDVREKDNLKKSIIDGMSGVNNQVRLKITLDLYKHSNGRCSVTLILSEL